MKIKSAFFLLSVFIILLLLNSCSSMNYKELNKLEDRTFYLDFFKTRTYEEKMFFRITKDDTIELQNYYAENIEIVKIKKLLEKKLNIKIDSTDFDAAVKQGPISENKNSKSGSDFSQWESPHADKHKNKIFFTFQCWGDKFIGYDGQLPTITYNVLLEIDGKFLAFEFDNYKLTTIHRGTNGIHHDLRPSTKDAQSLLRPFHSSLDNKQWIDYYKSCITLMYDSLKFRVDNLKKFN